MLEPAEIWLNLYHTMPEYVVEAVFPWTACIISFIIFTTPYILLDIFGCPSTLLKFKLNPKFKVNHDSLKKCAPLTMFNLLVTELAFESFAYFVYKWRGCTSGPEIPCSFEIFMQFLLCILAEDISYYSFHRLMHTKFMYERYHKVHHENSDVFSLTCMYCYPMEHVIKDLIPRMAGPLVLGSHTVVRLIWYGAVMMYTVCHHSGYMLPLLPSSEYHSCHHLNPDKNFGVLGIMDCLFNTDKVIFKRMQKEKD